MIIADACCGWNDFTEAFRREIELVFPGRPLRKLLPEDPVYSSYYKLGDADLQEGGRHGRSSRSRAWRGSISAAGARRDVSRPVIMTCGWDGHEHPRGTRVDDRPSRGSWGPTSMTYLSWGRSSWAAS